LPATESFLQDLRDALNHLYDPDHLRRSPLAELFGVVGRYDASSALRRILTDGIAALEPPPAEPPYSRAWRFFQALDYLYVQQMTQEAAAEGLAISDRQLRREQAAGIQALGDLLWGRHHLNDKALPSPDERQPASSPAATEALFQTEVAWLREPREAIADLGETLRRLFELLRPISLQHQARLMIGPMDGLSPLAIHPIALRQMLLKLLGLALARAEGGQVRLAAAAHGAEVAVTVSAAPLARTTSPVAAGVASSMVAIKELIALCGCRLAVTDEPGSFAATLWLPAYARVPVLAVDDNPDTLQLFQRYAADTRYRLIVTAEPEQILALAEKHAPRAIVLDVMMPRVDGWEVLARLRQHPLTAHIPVIVCSVLADADLASLLGATAILRKPVTQQSFLTALDQALDPMVAGPD